MLLITSHGDRTSSPVQLVQNIDVIVTNEKGAKTGGVAKYLIKGHGHEIGLVDRQVKTVRRNKSSSVKEDQPLVTLKIKIKENNSTSRK